MDTLEIKIFAKDLLIDGGLMIKYLTFGLLIVPILQQFLKDIHLFRSNI